ncbi:hypothetical protein, partial [uncultured Parabacteroides sp.]|uniref:hypothetical protein n=1 Tax=uncultured Parabacteroides sp. TaxID=512312 RepID=UPI00272A4AD2
FFMFFPQLILVIKGTHTRKVLCSFFTLPGDYYKKARRKRAFSKRRKTAKRSEKQKQSKNNIWYKA